MFWFSTHLYLEKILRKKVSLDSTLIQTNAVPKTTVSCALIYIISNTLLLVALTRVKCSSAHCMNNVRTHYCRHEY